MLDPGRGINTKAMAMHDPLTVAYLIDPTILGVKDYLVDIETTGEFTAGESVAYEYSPARFSPPINNATPSAEAYTVQFKPNAKVAVGVDAGKFFRLLLSRLTAA